MTWAWQGCPAQPSFGPAPNLGIRSYVLWPEGVFECDLLRPYVILTSEVRSDWVLVTHAPVTYSVQR